MQTTSHQHSTLFDIPAHFARLDSPIGRIELTSDGRAVTGIEVERAGLLPLDDYTERPAPVTDLAAGQLREYFDGTRRSFELPIVLEGTAFQHAVWRALGALPHGTAVTYGQLAQLAGHPRAVRATGSAVASNPIPLLVPCHRVLGRGGTITKYTVGNGPAVKEWLLTHEQIEFRATA